MKTLKGKMSTFGGPKDTGVSPSEGLALFEPTDLGKLITLGLFLPKQPPKTTGLARRLDPNAYYVAMRWDYAVTSRSYLREIVVTLTANGKSIQARPVDWGPNENTGRLVDMSPGAAFALGLSTDQEVTVILP